MICDMSEYIKISSLKPNPSNPRVVKDAGFQDTCISLISFPKMMEMRGLITDAEGYVHIGNTRLKAIQHIINEGEAYVKGVLDNVVIKERDRGNYQKADQAEEAYRYWVKIIDSKSIPKSWVKEASDFTADQLKEMAIKDNTHWGSWDTEMLANGWDEKDLTLWGVKVDWMIKYEPNYNPKPADIHVSQRDIEKAEKAQSKSIENRPEIFIDVVCPECLYEFKIKQKGE